MLRVIIGTSLVLGLSAQTLHSQELSEEARARRMAHAAETRAGVSCPVDVEWPELPARGRKVFRTGAVAVGEKPLSPGRIAELEKPRPDIVVPQYAFYYHAFPGEPKTCLPVIVVQSQGHALGWVAVLDVPPRAGGANEELFDLLGAEPPSQNPES